MRRHSQFLSADTATRYLGVVMACYTLLVGPLFPHACVMANGAASRQTDHRSGHQTDHTADRRTDHRGHHSNDGPSSNQGCDCIGSCTGCGVPISLPDRVEVLFGTLVPDLTRRISTPSVPNARHVRPLPFGTGPPGARISI